MNGYANSNFRDPTEFRAMLDYEYFDCPASMRRYAQAQTAFGKWLGYGHYGCKLLLAEVTWDRITIEVAGKLT